MNASVAQFARRTVRSLRKRLVPRSRVSAARSRMPDVAESDFEIMRRVEPFTMLEGERLVALIDATRHVVAANLPGAIVECGVWRGGAAMASMLALIQQGRTDRDYYLYDTFSGMCRPTQHDRRIDGRHALSEFHSRRTADDSADWCRATLPEVRQGVLATGYPAERVHWVEGKVEETIPATVPEQIALLRLDTDWYESTRHELEHLFPRLVRGGVLILDDYGHWEGARKATDDYFAEHHVSLLLSRTDYTGRMGVKTW